MKLLDGKKIAEKMIPLLEKDVSLLLKQGIRPGLGIVLVGSDPASELYVSSKEQVAKDLGLNTRILTLTAACKEDDVIAAIHSLNNDADIHGIIVQIPLPGHISFDRVQSAIDPAKDIDCFHPISLAALAAGKPLFVPPTAQSVITLARSSKKSLTGMHCAVVGRGFFARQIAALCIMHECHTTIIRPRAPRAKEMMKSADILISVVGKPEYITSASVKKRAIVIDVGISKVKDRVVGDVDFDSVKNTARAITPVPGGVGPLTVMYLMKNVIQAAQASQ